MKNQTPMHWLSTLSGILLMWLFVASAAADEFLDPSQAFKLKAELSDTHKVALDWTIAPGYKLYRERLSFEAEEDASKIGSAVLPDGERAVDPNLGQEVETYHDQLAVGLPVKAMTGAFTLKIKYQGCAEAGLCYPPITKRFVVDAAHPGALQEGTAQNSSSITATKPESTANTDTPRDEGTLAQQALQSRQLGRIGMMFLGFGLLLSLTPCVLPMVPILSSIIVGEGNVTRRRGFLLALSYSLGMALVYTGMGVAAGMAGEGLAGALQKPWVLITFAALLIGLALSMFDVYQLQLPNALQSRLSMTSDRFKGGRFTSVFIMGAISALIVGPCVAAPLAGALVYISQTHDVLIGGFALFSMALGMSVPLLLTGISAGSLLPRAGAWMNEVKHGFGLMLIGVAVWMLTPVLPGWALLFSWGAFAVLCAVFLRVFDPMTDRVSAGGRFVRALGLVFLLVGVLEFVGAASGGRDAVQPLGHMYISSNVQAKQQPDVRFSRIHNLAELENTLKTTNAPVLLDFYADWCVACKEMEHLTFSNAKVAEQLGKLVLLQADVTANNDEDRALMKQFSLFGPPGIILFNPAGQEIRHGRVVGYLEADAFLAHLKRYLAGFRSISQ